MDFIPAPAHGNMVEEQTNDERGQGIPCWKSGFTDILPCS